MRTMCAHYYSKEDFLAVADLTSGLRNIYTLCLPLIQPSKFSHKKKQNDNSTKYKVLTFFVIISNLPTRYFRFNYSFRLLPKFFYINPPLLFR